MITFVTRTRILLQEGDILTSKKGVMMESAMLGVPHLIHKMKVKNGALIALDKEEISEVNAVLR
jgi:hypothetical protein